MKKIISIVSFALFFLMFVYEVKAEQTCRVTLTFFKNNTVVLDELKVLPGESEEIYSFENFRYSLQLLTKDNKIIYNLDFNVNFFILSEPLIEVDNKTIINKIPCLDNYATKLKVYDKTEKNVIFETNLADDICNNNGICESEKGENQLLCPSDCIITTNGITTTTTTTEITTTTIQTCNNNNKCEPRIGENYNNCPEDCNSGLRDNYCDKVPDDICDPDCKEKEDIDCRKTNMLWVYIIIALVIIVLLVLFFTKIRGGGIERRR